MDSDRVGRGPGLGVRETCPERGGTTVTPKFTLAIPHASWEPSRVASLDRLLAQLRTPKDTTLRIFSDREPNHVWSVKVWRSLLELPENQATHLLQLQDDCQVNPDSFWADLTQIVATFPNEIIGLESVHPISEKIHATGAVPWYTTTDGLIGVAYVLPRPVVVRLLDWRINSLRADAAKKLNEDQLIGLFCATTNRRIYHPVPTIVDHDTQIPSTYGNDAHSFRRPAVTTVRGAPSHPGGWAVPPGTQPLHTGLFYPVTPRLARRFVTTVRVEDMDRIAHAR
jgi:hypothetical protein